MTPRPDDPRAGELELKSSRRPATKDELAAFFGANVRYTPPEESPSSEV